MSSQHKERYLSTHEDARGTQNWVVHMTATDKTQDDTLHVTVQGKISLSLSLHLELGGSRHPLLNNGKERQDP